ncbi:MAG: Dabb family protein [Thalassospira sp.]|uniref:Dabb family protein n=1 Tax=Thalassospira sp. TaxID=1912094 RepID=UPI0032EB00CC
MIRHIVLVQVSGSIPAEQIKEVLVGVEAAAFETPGMVAFAGGAKTTGSGLSQGFTHGYTIDFFDEEARDIYLAELDRDGIGRRLTDIAVGGLGGVLAMNIDISDIRTPEDNGGKKLQARWI